MLINTVLCNWGVTGLAWMLNYINYNVLYEEEYSLSSRESCSLEKAILFVHLPCHETRHYLVHAMNINSTSDSFSEMIFLGRKTYRYRHSARKPTQRYNVIIPTIQNDHSRRFSHLQRSKRQFQFWKKDQLLDRTVAATDGELQSVLAKWLCQVGQ